MRAPYAVPNGLQVTEQGIWIVDQLTDRMSLVAAEDPHEYGVSRILHEISTESSTTSGVSYGDGSLWLAANGPGSKWRAARGTDAIKGDILRVNPYTGETQGRWQLPGGGGTHGLDYDSYEPGTIWLSSLHEKTISQVVIEDWSVRRTVPLPYDGGHGMARVSDGLWMVFKQSRKICKLDLVDGKIMDTIDIGPEHPEPHGLTRLGTDLIYCDAMTGWIVKAECGGE